MRYENVINKANIKKQSIMFIFIVGFIIAFKTIFGDKNTLIGVTSITAMLMFINVDLTMSPIKNLIKLIVLNITTGVGAYIALLNPWIGIPINFVIIFVINYRLYFNLKESLYVPFALQYTFILATPVSLKEMPIRITSLLVAPIAIMSFQMIFNRKKIFKKGNRIIEDVCVKIIEKIDKFLNEDDEVDNDRDIDKEIRNCIDEFRAIVYDNRKEKFYITEEARIKINILASLEKVSIILNKIKYTDELEDVLYGLKQSMKRLEVVLDEDNNIEELEDYINDIMRKYEEIDISNIYIIEVLNSLEILKVSLSELRLLGKENYNKIKVADNQPSRMEHLKYKREFINKSVKLSFAVRSAIGITLAAFITDYFNLSEGKWLIFTMLSLVVPIYEVSIKRSKDRLFATLVGAGLIIILFSIFKSIAIRSIILMLMGYINSYLSEYRYKTICNTIAAIGSAALLGNTNILTMNRIIFVCIGIVLAGIINRFIMPRRIEDHARELEKIYLSSVKVMIKKVCSSPTENNTHAMNNLFIITSLIESRLENNKDFLDRRAIKSISQNRLLTLNIHELYILCSSEKFKKMDTQYVLEEMQGLTSYADQDIKTLLDKIEEQIRISDNIYNKIMLENIREVYKEIYKINKYVI